MTRRHKLRRPVLFAEAVEGRLLFSTFVVRTTADGGPDSLREAIVAASANDIPRVVDDEIVFNIVPAGPHTINLLSALPEITGNVTIDGTTQPGYATNQTPIIELNGQGAGPNADGLRIASVGPNAASNVLGLIINGFSGNGVVLSGAFNSLAQCYIGTDEAGAAPGPGNGRNGVLITGDHNLVGENVISFNGGDGVAVANGAVGNTVSPNSFAGNAGMAIDLGDDGPTPNDLGDPDDGANRRQNYPVITSVTAATAPATGLNVTGTINTTPSTLVEIVLYSSASNDGEGRAFLDILRPFETTPAGNGTFTANLPTATVSDWITATATTYAFTGDTSETNTSEFSPPVAAAAGGIAAVYVRGSAWAGPNADPANFTFMEYLESKGLGDDTYGFRIDNAAAGTVLPWINMDQVVVRYNSPPTGAGIPTPATLTLNGQGGAYPIASVTQAPGDPAAFVLNLGKPLGGGNPVTGVPPAPTENGDRVTLRIPGGGVAGTDYSLRMDVLQGDTDHAGETGGNHSVLAGDYTAVKKRFFKSTNSAAAGTDADYSVFHDVDGSGLILAGDYAEVKKRFFQRLPTPVAAAGFAARLTRDFFGVTPVLD